MRDPLNPIPPALRARVAALAPDVAADLARMPWQRLAGGRVNRVWRVGHLVVKLFRHAGHSPLFPNDPRAEVAALTALGPRALAPVLNAHGDDLVIYEHVEGTRFSGDPRPVARLLGRLHAQPAWAGLRAAPNGADELRADALRVAQGVSGLPPLPDVPDVPAGPVRPIHADPVAGNIILGAGGALLIDWQCPALGDAAEDLATFLSPAMQMVYKSPLSPGAARAFLAQYGRVDAVTRYHALAPLYHWRMAAHCLWRAAHGGGAVYGRAAAAEIAAIRADYR